MESNRTHIISRSLINDFQLSLLKHIYGNGVFNFIGRFTSFFSSFKRPQYSNFVQSIVNLNQLQVYIYCYLIGMTLATVIFILEVIVGKKLLNK